MGKMAKNNLLHEKFGLGNVLIITDQAALQATVRFIFGFFFADDEICLHE